MQTKHNIETIKSTYITGISAIVKILGIKKIFFKSWTTITPIVLTIISALIFYFFELDYYQGISEMQELMIDFLPSILGFTIAGYSLMVGFTQAGMLNKITEPSRNSKFSLYQVMSSVFAVNIILQAIALLIAYFVHFVMFVDKNKGVKIATPEILISIINLFSFLFLTYWFLVSLFMILQIILNIFNFSQVHHHSVNMEKLESENAKIELKNRYVAKRIWNSNILRKRKL